MKIKLLQRLLLITGITLFVGLQIHGQSLIEAQEAYNAGMDLVGTDIEAAIENVEKSLEIANRLGAEGEEVKELAEIQIPGLYYDKAMAHYRERDIEQALDGFAEAMEIS